MAAATATFLHDPWSQHHSHYSPADTAALIDLLAVDYLVDSHRTPPKEHTLLEDLWKVDLQFRQVDVREHDDAHVHKDTFLDLLATDQEVDLKRNSKRRFSGQHYSTAKALHDPYVPKEDGSIHLFTGVYAGENAGSKRRNDDASLKDNAVMMHLLSVDESVDDRKRWTKDVESDDYALIGDLYEIDVEVSGAKRRALLVEDLQGLLDVDHLVDGVKKEKTPAKAKQVGKRSIFSSKEKSQSIKG